MSLVRPARSCDKQSQDRRPYSIPTREPVSLYVETERFLMLLGIVQSGESHRRQIRGGGDKCRVQELGAAGSEGPANFLARGGGGGSSISKAVQHLIGLDL